MRDILRVGKVFIPAKELVMRFLNAVRHVHQVGDHMRQRLLQGVVHLDHSQQEVLRMMHSEHGIDLAVAKEIHAEYTERRKTARKVIKDNYKQ